MGQKHATYNTGNMPIPADTAGRTVAHLDLDSSDKGVLVIGYLICQSENLKEVQAWSATCPILKYPESSVEIRPVIPFPNQ